jgi:hypothetical protein
LPDSERTSERVPISLEGKPSKIGTKLYFLPTMKKENLHSFQNGEALNQEKEKGGSKEGTLDSEVMLGIVNRRQKMRGMNTKKIEENGI